MDIGNVTAVISTLIAIGAMIVAWRKAPHEIHVADAESAARDAEASRSYAEAARQVAEQNRKLQTKLAMLEKRIDDQDRKIRHLEQENADLRDWAERLSYQVASLGGTPVAIRVRKPAGE